MIDVNDYENIIIYQYGKCGSSSLRDLFKQVHSKVIHTHSPKNIPPRENLGKRDLIINVTRNLFDRNISDYFQNISRFGHYWYVNNEENLFKMPIGEILRKYNERIYFYITNNLYTWYDNFELKTGTNVFEEPFNRKNKYLIYDNKDYTTVVLRYEDINDWNYIISKIFINELPPLPKSNISKNKKIYYIMEEFKKKYHLTAKMINTVKKANVMIHFYTEDELKEIIKKYKTEIDIPKKEIKIEKKIETKINSIGKHKIDQNIKETHKKYRYLEPKPILKYIIPASQSNIKTLLQKKLYNQNKIDTSFVRQCTILDKNKIITVKNITKPNTPGNISNHNKIYPDFMVKKMYKELNLPKTLLERKCKKERIIFM
jgi:hypothetical protein